MKRVCVCPYRIDTCEKDKMHIQYEDSIGFLIVHPFLAFLRVVFVGFLFDMP